MRRVHPANGITLLEIMFAVIILAMSMIPIAGVMGVGLRGTSKDFRNLSAIQFLEGTMRQVLAADYSRVPTGALTTPVNLGTFTLPLGDIASGGTTFNLSLQVTEEAVSMRYRPIRVDLGSFVATNPSTWVFDGAVSTLDFDNSNTMQAFRVKRIQGLVTWSEYELGAQKREIRMTTFLTKVTE